MGKERIRTNRLESIKAHVASCIVDRTKRMGRLTLSDQYCGDYVISTVLITQRLQRMQGVKAQRMFVRGSVDDPVRSAHDSGSLSISVCEMAEDVCRSQTLS